MNSNPRVPPLAVVLATAACMWSVAWFLPSMQIAFGGRTAIAAGCVFVGLLVSLAGVVAFRRARTTVNPLTPGAASSLVVDGIFRFTRNPMYLGFAIVLLGWGVYVAHPIAALGLPAFIAYVNRFQIAPEERALRVRFGLEFARYAGQVRRWL